MGAARGHQKPGVVTRADLQTFEQGDLSGGFVARPYSTADGEIAALAASSDVPMGNYDGLASLMTIFEYLGTENMSVIVTNMDHTTLVEKSPPLIEAFTSFSALTSTQRNTRLSELVTKKTMNSLGGLK